MIFFIKSSISSTKSIRQRKHGSKMFNFLNLFVGVDPTIFDIKLSSFRRIFSFLKTEFLFLICHNQHLESLGYPHCNKNDYVVLKYLFFFKSFNNLRFFLHYFTISIILLNNPSSLAFLFFLSFHYFIIFI